MLEATPTDGGAKACAQRYVHASNLQTLGGSVAEVETARLSTDMERGYSNSDVTASSIPIGTTILVQQHGAQPPVLQKFAIGPAVVTESLYEQLPNSEVPYISLEEFLTDETNNKNDKTDLTCTVPPLPAVRAGQFQEQQLRSPNKQTLPMINGSLTSSPTSSSSSHELEEDGSSMGYHPSGSTGALSQLSIFRRQTNNPLQLNFRENIGVIPRLSSTSPVSEVSDEDSAMHTSISGRKENRRRSKKPVPDEKKDETYWRRRHKNNLAAKRSREARRQKESDLTKKATLLEVEHEKLKSELDEALKQNSELRMRLSKYEDV